MTAKTQMILKWTVALTACWLFVSVAGCGSPGPESSLPQPQADAYKALKALGAKIAIRNEEVVYVDFYGMSDVDSALVHLKAFPHLQKLNFSSTRIKDDALVHLADLAELKELALNRTEITDQGLVHLADLTKLEILNFNEDNLTDAGLVHLQNLKGLKQLHLNETKISDAGLQHLDGLDQLEMLLAYGTAVTASGAETFREKHPDTEIVAAEGENLAGPEPISE